MDVIGALLMYCLFLFGFHHSEFESQTLECICMREQLRGALRFHATNLSGLCTLTCVSLVTP